MFHHLDPLTARAAFRDASDVFLAATGAVPAGGWDEPGLGEWTVRELTAHALRAFLTLQRLCDTTGGAPQLESAMAYYRAVAVREDVHAGVLQRGREAGAQLVDPEATARRTAEQALGRLAATPDEHVGETFAGPMRLADYLPTRVVELGIHTLDLQRGDGPADGAAGLGRRGRPRHPGRAGRRADAPHGHDGPPAAAGRLQRPGLTAPTLPAPALDARSDGAVLYCPPWPHERR